MPNNPNYIHLIILLLFVGFSVISWVVRKLQEQAQIRRIQAERERRELEMLRTGRVRDADAPPVATGGEGDRLRDLAARRQAQLQELRRRAQERMRAERGEGGPRQESPVVYIPGSAGPVVVERGRTPRPPATTPPPRPVPAGRTPVPVRRPGQGGQPVTPRPARVGPAPEPQRRRSAQPPPVREPSRRRAEPVARPSAPPPPRVDPAAAVPPAPVAAGAAARRGPVAAGAALLGGRRMTPEEWRRAFIMKELLSEPVGLRDPGGEDRPF